MAEIVRLLRWRAEWDGAGLVDGAAKAAAAGERLRKSLDEVGAAGPAALQKTSKAAKETDVAFEGLGLEAQQVEMYLGRLEKGSGSPLVLQRNAELAAAAMSVLSQSAERAGQTIPQAFSERVAAAIGAAKTQAAGMNAELEKMGGQTPTKLDKVITALDKTAQAGQRAAGALGEASAATGRVGKTAETTAKANARLGDSMRKSTEGVTKFKGAALEAWGALALGKTIGEGLAKAIDKVSASAAAHDKVMNDAAVNTIKFEAAMRLAEKGVIALGGSQEQFLAGYDAYIAKTSPATQKTIEQKKALEEQKRAWEELKAAMDAAAEGKGFSILSPEDADKMLDPIRSLATGLEDALRKAFEVGGKAERDAWAKANKAAVEKVIAAYEKAGIKIPEHLGRAAEGFNKGADAATDWANEINDSYQKLIDKQQEWIKESGRIADEMRNWTDATQGPRSAFGALSGDFTGINAEVQRFVEAGGKASDVMVGMTEVAMTWNKSTEEMNRTLERQLEIMGRLDDKMLQTLDKFEQWRSAIATAVSALQDGTTSSAGFIEMMNQLETQLSTNFGAAAGEAGDEVRKLIATIQALIATATMGGGGTLDPTLWGGLEREYGRRN